jgi:hypothetical protein
MPEVFFQRKSVLMQFTWSMSIQCVVPSQGLQQHETSEIIPEGGKSTLLTTWLFSSDMFYFRDNCTITSIIVTVYSSYRTLQRYAW